MRDATSSDIPHAQVVGSGESGGGGGGGGPINPGWPPTVGREPLPPFPQATGDQPGNPQAACWSAKGDYRKTPSAVPAGPDRRYHRGNFCGVSVPGFKGGYNPQDPSLIMTWELPTFSAADQELILRFLVGVCGHTHIVLSIPQAKNYAVPLGQLMDCCRRCQQAGLYLSMVAVSDGDRFAVAIPWLQQMLDAGVLVRDKDTVCGCWQVDKWYSEPDVVELILDNGSWSHPHGLLTTIHWGGGYTGWAENCACWDETTEARWGIHDRWSFQKTLAPALDGHYGQCNVDAPIDEKQSWLLKALVAMPSPMFLVAMETSAQGRFDDPRGRPEVWCDMDGLLCTYASPDGRISWGNGARKPDGTVW